MKRDMDLIRELLLKLEDEHLDGNFYSLKPDGLGIEGRSYEELSYHLTLLIDAGLLDGERELSGQFAVRNITWRGHEFLDTVRNPEIWRETKSGVAKIGGASAEFVWEIAKGQVKHLVKEKLGIDVS